MHRIVPSPRAAWRLALLLPLAFAGGCKSGGRIAVANVLVTMSSTSIIVGQSAVATATTVDDQGNALTGRAITWGTSAPTIATVTTAGAVTAVGVGTAAITATSEGKTGSVIVTVIPPPVATVTVALGATSIAAGATTTATATLRDASGNVLSGRVVTWSSSATNVASVSGTGTVTGVGAGTASIIATSEGRTGQANITVTGGSTACTFPAVLTAAPTINLGAAVNGTLASGDCRLDDGSYIDFYRLVISSTTNVRIDLVSASFDAYLFLLDAAGNVITFDDDNGGGTNSRITRSLTAATYYIGANSFSAGETGPYTLTTTATAASLVQAAGANVVIERVSPRERPALLRALSARKPAKR